MPGRALQGRRHREVHNPVTPLTGGAYAEIISTKGLTAQQKDISVILETAGSEFQSRRRWCSLSLSSISNQVNHALAKVTWDKEQIEEYKVEHGVTSVKKITSSRWRSHSAITGYSGHQHSANLFSSGNFIL